MNSAWKEVVLWPSPGLADPGGHRLSGLFSDFELYGALSLLLHDDCACRHPVTVADVADTQFVPGPASRHRASNLIHG
jgi:hypothetical protein